jgi:hypothetical protein
MFSVQVGETTKGGNRDWSSLIGKILCSGCYNQYRKKGTLEREAAHKSQKEDEDDSAASNDKPSSLRCSYSKCQKPLKSNKYYRVSETYSAGGQNWTPILGSTLCHACYRQYKRTGSFDRPLGKKFESTQRRCTNAGCDNPNATSRFFIVDDTFKAGGRDWSSLLGHVLCHACYSRFRQRGTLTKYAERGDGATGKEEVAAKGKKRKSSQLETNNSNNDLDEAEAQNRSSVGTASSSQGMLSIGMVSSENVVRLDASSEATEVAAMVAAANDAASGIFPACKNI